MERDGESELNAVKVFDAQFGALNLLCPFRSEHSDASNSLLCPVVLVRGVGASDRFAGPVDIGWWDPLSSGTMLP